MEDLCPEEFCDKNHRGKLKRVTFREANGLFDWGDISGGIKGLLKKGDNTPKVLFGFSTFKIFNLWLNIKTRWGSKRKDRLSPVYNFYNRNTDPEIDSCSIRKTNIEDWRGGKLSYDGHWGTDFTAPAGSRVVAAAPGRVFRVERSFYRGGLTVGVDHGEGILTSYFHLSRVFVKEGQMLARAELIGLSGTSGLDFVLSYPWNTPHLHFNVWVNGKQVDPFAREGEIPLFIDGNRPKPYKGPEDKEFIESDWNYEAIGEGIENCLDEELKSKLLATDSIEIRAAKYVFSRSYQGYSFDCERKFYKKTYERKPLLTLPFAHTEFKGVYYKLIKR
jgi:hypothetical protein